MSIYFKWSLTGLFVVFCATLSYVFITVGYAEPTKTTLVPISIPDIPLQIEEKSAKGIWKKDKTGAYNFYCANTGGYEGHVMYMDNGYWNTYEGGKQDQTFIDISSAKRFIEKIAECK